MPSIRKLALFAGIVWRRYPAEKRISVGLAWEVAGIIHGRE